METHPAAGVAVQGGVQRSPAAACTAPAPCGKCETPVPAHGALGAPNVGWAKEKAQRAAPATGFGLLRHLRSIFAAIHKKLRGNVQLVEQCHSCSGILTLLEGHSSCFRVSSLCPEPCRALSSVCASCKLMCSRVSSLLVWS